MKKIFLPLLLTITVCCSAQKVSNKLSFQQGQKLEVTTNMNMTTESMLGETSGNAINIEEYIVANSSALETTLQKTPKKMTLSFSMMGKEYTMDSDNKEDMEGQFGEPIKQLMKEKYEFNIDGSGKVISVKADKKEDNGGSGMMGMVMPGMNAGGGIPATGNPSVFKFLPDDRDVAKGDTWTDTITTSDNQTKTVYTIKDVTDNEVLLDFIQDGTIKSSQSTMGMTVDVTAASKTTGTVTLDRTTGIMKQRTAITSTESNMNMGGREMASTTKMTTVTTVKTL